MQRMESIRQPVLDTIMRLLLLINLHSPGKSLQMHYTVNIGQLIGWLLLIS